MGNAENWVLDDLISFSEYTWLRTKGRLEGLSDEEYLWEPVPSSWSLRPRDDGSWRLDLVVPAPDPAPFTTLAWRIAHLIQCYGQVRNRVMLGVDDDAPDIPWRQRATGGAAEALDALDRGYERWQRVLAALDDESLAAPIGPVGGQYAEASRAGFVLHMFDEFVHHGAEVATVRDLYRATTTPVPEPTTIAEAAALGRWSVVIDLAKAGGTIDNEGVTPLHLAAGAGEARAVEVLIARGADTTVRDPGFRATPAEWATYFGHSELAERLAGG